MSQEALRPGERINNQGEKVRDAHFFLEDYSKREDKYLGDISITAMSPFPATMPGRERLTESGHLRFLSQQPQIDGIDK